MIEIYKYIGYVKKILVCSITFAILFYVDILPSGTEALFMFVDSTLAFYYAVKLEKEITELFSNITSHKTE